MRHLQVRESEARGMLDLTKAPKSDLKRIDDMQAYGPKAVRLNWYRRLFWWARQLVWN